MVKIAQLVELRTENPRTTGSNRNIVKLLLQIYAFYLLHG